MNQYEHISAIGPSDACPFVLVVYVVVRISQYTSSLGPGQVNSVVNSVCKCPRPKSNKQPFFFPFPAHRFNIESWRLMDPTPPFY